MNKEIKQMLYGAITVAGFIAIVYITNYPVA